MTRRLLLASAAGWVGIWLAREVASRLGRRLPAGPTPLESPRPPGWMPRRLDSGRN